MPVNEVRALLMTHETAQNATIVAAMNAVRMVFAGMAGELATQRAALMNDLNREISRTEALSKVQVSVSPVIPRGVPMAEKKTAQNNDEQLCNEIKAMMPKGAAAGDPVGLPWGLFAKLLQLLQLLFPQQQAMAAAGAVGHAIGHVDDPFECFMIATDSSKEIAERVCATCDALHFGSKTFLPHNS